MDETSTMNNNRTAHIIDNKARTDDIHSEERVSFAEMLLSNTVLLGLKSAGFEKPSPIQLKAIPLGRCGLDLIVQAKSGTGKTCVFSVITLESILVESNSLQALILAPTREIAVQIWEVIRSIGSAMPSLRCYTFIGGLPIADDKLKLKKCHIAIGTPGRIKQLIEENLLNTESIRLFVLDEADKLLEESFQGSINWIYSSLPQNKQILALSATYPEFLARHLTSYMRNPTYVRLNTSDPALLGIRQYVKTVPFHPLPQKVFNAKSKALMDILSAVNFNQCLVFSNYQMRAQSLSDLLVSNGWPSAFISGSQDQAHRLTAMAKLKQFKCRVLISTDLTSRGIDAENVNLIVNLDVPRNHETYLHRIGRAGRFGSYGAAISLVTYGKEMADLKTIEKNCSTKINDLPDPIPGGLARDTLHVSTHDCVEIEETVSVSEILSISTTTSADMDPKFITPNGNTHYELCVAPNPHPQEYSHSETISNHEESIANFMPETLQSVEEAISKVSNLLKVQGQSSSNSIIEQRPSRPLVLSSSVLPTVKVPNVTLESSYLNFVNCEDIWQDQQLFRPRQAEANQPPATRPVEKVMHCTQEDMESAVNQMAILLDRLSVDGSSDTVGYAEMHHETVIEGAQPEVTLTSSAETSKREVVHSCENTEHVKRPLLKPRLLSPLSIDVGDASFPGQSISDHDLAENYIARLGARLSDDDSDEFTSISELEMPSNRGSNSDLHSSSVSAEEGSRESQAETRGRTRTAYPNNQFHLFDEPDSEGYLQDGQWFNSNVGEYDCSYVDYYCDNVEGEYHTEPGYSNDYATPDAYGMTTWNSTLDQSSQYAHWLNSVHLSNYAQFCWQSYTMHKRYSDYFENIYHNVSNYLDRVDASAQ